MGRNSAYSKSSYREKQSQITKENWQIGIYDKLKSSLVDKKCLNPKCNVLFQVKSYEPKKYCSSHCANSVNNTLRIHRTSSCLVCGKYTKRVCYKYCSLQCQMDERYNRYIHRWLKGLETGNIGLRTRTLSHHLRRYILQKYQNKCSKCGWNQRHPTTGIVPLEVNHIDGNAENNKEENLELLCPNCHSLTPNFRNLNKGKGRSWRIEYLKNQKVV